MIVLFIQRETWGYIYNGKNSSLLEINVLVYCCDMRLVQIGNQAQPSELIPKYVYEELSWLEINSIFLLYI
jgi:hypothetical protein